MALNVWIRGTSARGFRAFETGTGNKRVVKEKAALQIDVDDQRNQEILRREMGNFIRVASGASTTAIIRGLQRRGFRIKANDGTTKTVKADTAVTVNLDDTNVLRVLRRHLGQWVRVPNATQRQVTIRGIQESQRSFRVNRTRAARLTTAMAGANNDLTFTAKEAGPNGNAITVALVNPGGTAARSIAVAGNAITVNLAVTAGAINASETASSIAGSINGDAAASALVTAAVAASNDGTGVVTALAATPLSGGTLSERELPVSVRKNLSVAVDVNDPDVQASLRRHFTDWVEVDA